MFLQGTIVLWLTAILPQLRPPPCDQLSITNCGTPATITQLAILYTSLGLISLGAGCLMPCSMAFGADQLDHKDNPNNERALQGFFNWYYATGGVATLLGVTVLVYIQDSYGWGVGLAVPAFLVLFSTLLFLLPSSIYVKHEARGSLLVGCFRVLVAAIRKQGSYNNVKDEQLTQRLHEDLDDGSHQYFRGLDNNDDFITPTSNLRYSTVSKQCTIYSKLSPNHLFEGCVNKYNIKFIQNSLLTTRVIRMQRFLVGTISWYFVHLVRAFLTLSSMYIFLSLLQVSEQSLLDSKLRHGHKCRRWYSHKPMDLMHG
ncbi:Protein NRT1/ PTR FAMILY 1.1 [Linum perenne]